MNIAGACSCKEDPSGRVVDHTSLFKKVSSWLRSPSIVVTSTSYLIVCMASSYVVRSETRPVGAVVSGDHGRRVCPFNSKSACNRLVFPDPFGPISTDKLGVGSNVADFMER